MDKSLIITEKDLKPSRPDFRVLGVFNPAVAPYQGKTLMLARVAETPIQKDPISFVVPFYRDGDYDFLHLSRSDAAYDFSDSRVIRGREGSYLTSVSHFAIGESLDGIHFSFDGRSVFPEGVEESFGIEDPRITFLEGHYYITYVAVSPLGINSALMVTDDFVTFKRLGILFPNNKDCVLFPQKIKGSYVAFHRPNAGDFGKLDMWLAKSPDLFSWGHHEALLAARISYGSSARVGAGAVPFLTPRGWVAIYHTADAFNHYHLTAMLMDKDDPSRILAKSVRPLLEPSEPFETCGFFPDVAFTCGLIEEKGKIRLYYGACDQCVGLAFLPFAELWKNLEACP